MPWTIIFTLALKIFNFIFGKVKASDESKKAFLSFVAAIENDSLASINLNDQDRKQLNELKARRDKLNKTQDEE